jgi:hypothetical protein
MSLTRESEKLRRVMNRNHEGPHNAFSFNTDRAKELRKDLFPGFKRTPGRKIKYFILLGALLNLTGSAKMAEIRKVFERRERESASLQRKTTPFLQSMADLRYLALIDRDNLMKEALFGDRSEEWKKAFNRRYIMDQPYTPTVNRIPFSQSQSVRNMLPYWDVWRKRVCHGYEIPGV